jgi:hypothetical protein
MPTTPSNNTCCPNLFNLIKNSAFDDSLRPSTSSQYILDGAPAVNSTKPGEYTIINGSQAKIICDRWDVWDHTTCNSSSGSFMVVNGETSQPSNINNIIWQQTVTGIEKDSIYKFCVYMKNLPACCFDDRISVRVEFKSSVSTWSIHKTIQTTNAPCNWQLVETSFTGKSSSVLISISIGETRKGDGNDLAIDDISLVKIPKVPKKFTIFSSIQFNLTATTFNTKVSPVLSFQNDCSSKWQVCEIDPDGNCISNTIKTFDNCSIPCTFNNYIFNNNKSYRITYGVGCNCYSWNTSSWTYTPVKGKKKKIVFKEDKKYKPSLDTFNEIAIDKEDDQIE